MNTLSLLVNYSLDSFDTRPNPLIMLHWKVTYTLTGTVPSTPIRTGVTNTLILMSSLNRFSYSSNFAVPLISLSTICKGFSRCTIVRAYFHTWNRRSDWNFIILWTHLVFIVKVISIYHWTSVYIEFPHTPAVPWVFLQILLIVLSAWFGFFKSFLISKQYSLGLFQILIFVLIEFSQS